jgi:hypothetical protein
MSFTIAAGPRQSYRTHRGNRLEHLGMDRVENTVPLLQCICWIRVLAMPLLGNRCCIVAYFVVVA